MGRNIIICSDGTGNTFGRRVTNVTELVKCLALDDHTRQVAAYDQGVGTGADRQKKVEEYREGLPDPDALSVLPPPLKARFRPVSDLTRLCGLLFGYGLKQNVREMYLELSDLYEGPDDRVFLIGFSRGAYTVRALAGLLFRCGLPHRGSDNLGARFNKAWRLFKPMHEDIDAVRDFRADQLTCAIHFMGLWDTVKSCGGLNPVMLPHLRHNPFVTHVRHALALDEERAWFDATMWGLLDGDACGAGRRLKKEHRPLYESQDIAEVWFTGCHSDIGGGDRQAVTARIALRWMLGEAVNVSPPMHLNDHGEALLRQPDPPDPPEVHQSMRLGWRIAGALPRREIHNFEEYPVKKWGRGSRKRDPGKLRRHDRVFVHASAAQVDLIPGRVEICHTQPMPG